MRLRTPIRTTVAVAATTLAMALLPALSAPAASASSGPITVAAPNCSHSDHIVGDGIKSWKYIYLRHYNNSVGLHFHVYHVFFRFAGGNWVDQGQQSFRC